MSSVAVALSRKNFVDAKSYISILLSTNTLRYIIGRTSYEAQWGDCEYCQLKGFIAGKEAQKTGQNLLIIPGVDVPKAFQARGLRQRVQLRQQGGLIEDIVVA